MFPCHQVASVYCSVGPIHSDAPTYAPFNSLQAAAVPLQKPLEEYNRKRAQTHQGMGIVLDDNTTEHLVRIMRVLAMPGGHALMVGLPGTCATVPNPNPSPSNSIQRIRQTQTPAVCSVPMWCGVVRCGVPKALLPKGKRPGCLPTGKGKRAGLCVLCARRA